MALTVTGEVRGVRVNEGQGRNGPYRNVYLVVEGSDFQNYELQLRDEHIQSGFENQLPGLRGKQVAIPVSCRGYKDKVYYSYYGNKLPKILDAADLKRAS